VGSQPGSIDWRTVRIRPGALFIVGDPKQSIYRFRRADIDVYNTVRDIVLASGGEVLPLTACWRSLPEVCALANSVFPTRFPATPTAEAPMFEPLDPIRRAPEDAALATGIAKLTVPAGVNRSQVAAAEADRIATYIKGEVEAGRRQYRDFLVLTRATPRLGVYAAECERLEIPVEVSGAGHLVESAEVATLCLLLRCLADPLDALALVGVLRGPLFGLSDQELFAYRHGGGRFDIRMATNHGSEATETRTADPVRDALVFLNRLYRFTRTLPAGAAIERIVEATGFLALAATTADGARAGELLQAIDRMRQVAELGGSLADGAAALEADAPLSSEMESLPLEPGRRDVVRIMNLHKAKGLEADVVFLADPCHGYVFPASVRIVRDGDTARGYLRIEWRAEQGFARRLIGLPVGWAAHEATEQRYIDAETDRLLYVAATRARDLLVVGRWAKASGNHAWPPFSGYVAGCSELTVSSLTARANVAVVDCSAAVRLAAAADRDQRHAHVRGPSWAATNVTEEAHHQGPAPRIREALTPEPGVPAATDVGSASVLQDTSSHRADTGYAWGWLIHGLLEHAMRIGGATRADLERLARWLTVESPDLRPHIPQAIEVVEGVAKATFWKDAAEATDRQVEVPFSIRASGDGAVPVVMRGVIDLVYRSPDGWRIVDYKTDQLTDATKVRDRYASQVNHYQAAWGAIAHGPTSGALFLVRTGDLVPTVQPADTGGAQSS
jgi:ATP-dependent helicase/nuclease subunit A